MILAVASAAAFSLTADTYAETATTSSLAKGMELTTMERFTQDGWQRMHVVEVDLTSSNLSPTLLKPTGGIGTKSQVTAMLDQAGALVGINGDFFYKNINNSSIGAMIEDGKLLANSIPFDYRTASTNTEPLVIEDKYKGLSFQSLVPVLSITVNGQSWPLDGWNKASSGYWGLFAYDRNWGEYSIGTAADNLVEIVVVNNRVKEIRTMQAAVAIPEDGFVLAQRADEAASLLSNLKVGDAVSVTTSPYLSNIEMALGTGGYLVEDGLIKTDFSLSISGRHPRTAMGLSKDGETLYLVTVEGRYGNYLGMTQTELASFMKEVGAYTAVNLDGGGSTTLAYQTPAMTDPILVNQPSDGSERYVSNGFGIEDRNPAGSLTAVEILPADGPYLPGVPIDLTLNGLDTYDHPMQVSNYKYATEGVAVRWKNGAVIPESSGFLTIHVASGNVEDSKTIWIDGPIQALESQQTKIILAPNQSLDLADYLAPLTGKNSQGTTLTLSPSDWKLTTVGGIGTLSGTRFTASALPSAGGIVIAYEDARLTIPVTVGVRESLVHELDDLQAFSDSQPFYVKQLPTRTSVTDPDNYVDVEGLVTEGVESGTSSLALKYDFAHTSENRSVDLLMGDKGIKLGYRPDGISFWCYGDGQGALLKIKVSDGYGKNYYLPMTRITFTGWQKVSVTLPDYIQGPVTVKRLYLYENRPESRYSGTVRFDRLMSFTALDTNLPDLPASTSLPLNIPALSANVPQSDRFLVACGIEAPSTFLDYLLAPKLESAMAGGKVGIYLTPMTEAVHTPRIGFLDPMDSAYAFQYGGVQIIQLDMADGGLRTSDDKGWPILLKKLEESTEENLIILLSDSLSYFTDDKERQVFLQAIQQASQFDRKMIIMPGKEAKITKESGIYAITIQQPDRLTAIEAADYQILEIQLGDQFGLGFSKLYQ
jgi:exopolysaccharide biosynthesis protein